MPRPQRNMKRTNLYIPESHLKGTRWLARRKGVTMSDIVRDALKAHLSAELPKYQ